MLGGYGVEVRERLIVLARKHIAILKPTTIISGVALGWDTAVAIAATMDLVPWIAAIPFVGQENNWPEIAQLTYRTLLQRAERVEVVSPGGFAKWKMGRRNSWMVEHADHMLALWSGAPGGTANCIEHAVKKGIPINNLWLEWSAA